jgi:hypothetical protein
LYIIYCNFVRTELQAERGLPSAKARRIFLSYLLRFIPLSAEDVIMGSYCSRYSFCPVEVDYGEGRVSMKILTKSSKNKTIHFAA